MVGCCVALVWPVSIAWAEAGFNESGGERQVLRFDDLSSDQPGMAPPAKHAGFAVNRSLIRGFANDSTLRNGYRDFAYLGQESEAAQEGVEVFKGPASALYGNGKPGGDINVLTRQPDGVRHRDLRWQVSRFGRAEVRADLGGELGSDREGAYRVGVLAAGGQDYRQFDGDTLHAIAPSWAWRPSARTLLQLEGDLVHVRDHNQPVRLPLPEIAAFPGRKTLGERTDVVRVSGHTWRASLVHALSEDWRWRQSAFVQGSRQHGQNAELDVFGLTGPSVLSDDGRQALRVSERNQKRTTGRVMQSELYGRLTSWQIEHQLLIGLEWGRYEASLSGQRAPLAALDLLAPVHGAQAGPFVPVNDQTFGYRTRVAYLQDRARLSERWQALLGLRVQHVAGRSDNRLDAQSTRGSDVSYSPRAGLVYQWRPGLAFYGSVTHSSSPQLGDATADGKLLPPEESGQLEWGVQWGRPDQGMLGTLSVYQLTKRNLATTDLRNPKFSVAAGERQSHGVELALRGALARGVDLDASVEVMRAEVKQDNDRPSGAALPGVAPWFASMWLTWQWDANWTLGWGLVGEGPRKAGWPPYDMRLPAYVTTDGSLAYRGTGWRLQLSLANVLGRRVVESDGAAITHVTPRALTLAMSIGW